MKSWWCSDDDKFDNFTCNTTAERLQAAHVQQPVPSRAQHDISQIDGRYWRGIIAFHLLSCQQPVNDVTTIITDVIKRGYGGSRSWKQQPFRTFLNVNFVDEQTSTVNKISDIEVNVGPWWILLGFTSLPAPSLPFWAKYVTTVKGWSILCWIPYEHLPITLSMLEAVIITKICKTFSFDVGMSWYWRGPHQPSWNIALL